MLQVDRIDTGEQLLAQLGGDGLDLLDQRLSFGTQGDLLGPPIFGYCLATDQALRLQAIEQARQGRALD